MSQGLGESQVPVPPAPQGRVDASTSPGDASDQLAPSGDGWAAPGSNWSAEHSSGTDAPIWEDGGWGGGPPASPPRRSKRRRVVVAVAVGVVILLVVGGIVAAGMAMVEDFASWSPDDWAEWDEWADLPPTFGPDGSEQAFPLAVGDCASGAGDDASWAAAAPVPCSDAHDVEIFATVEVPDLAGDAYPGRPELESYGYGACELAFMPYVGARYLDSEYDHQPVVPTRAAWDAGARRVHCVLTSMYGETAVGSARGSGR